MGLLRSLAFTLVCWIATSLGAMGALGAMAASVPLPDLSQGAELRVAYVHNPRLTGLMDDELTLILDTAREVAREHFGITVRFHRPDKLGIDDLFQRFARGHFKTLGSHVYDFKHGRGDIARLRKSYVQTLGRHKDDLQAQIDYVTPYLLNPVASRDYQGLADALVDTHLARLSRLREERLADGSPLLNDAPFNEYVYWASLDLIRLQYEVVITNQLIASAEYLDAEVHAAIRGGISNGVTNHNGGARYLATAVVSTYPFVGEDPTTRLLRNNEQYARRDALRYAAYMLVHELGHQLLHLGHPFGNRACVMTPPELLHFRAWVNQLSAAACPLLGSGQAAPMQPGFIKFRMPTAP